jgi:hypothetical protein
MRVTGDKELVANLRALAKGIPAGVIDKAAAKAMKPMTDEAVSIARAHRQPGPRPKGGHLDEGIAFRKSKKQTSKKRSYALGAIGRARKILTLLEFGVAPHVQPIRLHGGVHPGHQAFPIMRPAYDSHSDEVPREFGVDIGQYLQSRISKMKK